MGRVNVGDAEGTAAWVRGVLRPRVRSRCSQTRLRREVRAGCGIGVLRSVARDVFVREWGLDQLRSRIEPQDCSHTFADRSGRQPNRFGAVGFETPRAAEAVDAAEFLLQAVLHGEIGRSGRLAARSSDVVHDPTDQLFTVVHVPRARHRQSNRLRGRETGGRNFVRRATCSEPCAKAEQQRVRRAEGATFHRGPCIDRRASAPAWWWKLFPTPATALGLPIWGIVRILLGPHDCSQRQNCPRQLSPRRPDRRRMPRVGRGQHQARGRDPLGARVDRGQDPRTRRGARFPRAVVAQFDRGALLHQSR
jgi:hypothetical protein